MSSQTEDQYHGQANSASFVAPNPHNAQPTNDSILSILPSGPGGAEIHSVEVGQPRRVPSPPVDTPSMPPPSKETCFPSTPDGASISNARRFQPLESQCVTSTPTPTTAMSPLGSLDTFVQSLQSLAQGSPHPPSSASVTCSVKQNDEPENVHGRLLEQRLEKKMNIQLSAAANQRIKLPVPPVTFTNEVSEPHSLFLSLVIAGETTRRIFGGVGHYHQDQSKPEIVQIIEGSNFSPVVGITSGRTISIGFKFTKYPRQCDPSEEAFRVVATLHDSGGQLVAYCLSASAYSVKSHPRNTKRQASADEPENTEQSRSKRRRTDLTTRNHILPSNFLAAVSPEQQHPSDYMNTGGHSVVEPAVSRSVETQIPMIDPQLQSLLHEQSDFMSLNPLERYQQMPTLDEAVPASCNWRGGIFISLYVSNLPPDGPLYARFGYIVVKTDRKTSHTLSCRVPAAEGPCEVNVTLSKSSGPLDAIYGLSLCKFTYEEDDITRLVRLLKAEAYNSNSLQWHAATAIQQHATRHRLVPSQSQANQSTYGQSTLGQWSLTSHARIETVEEEDEKVDDATQPEPSNNLSDLDTTPHGPSEMEYERSESVENTVRQNTKPLDAVELSDPKRDATLQHISKPNDSPTPKLKKSAIHIILSEPLSATEYDGQAHLNPSHEAPSGTERTIQQPLDCALPVQSQLLRPADKQANTSPTGVCGPTISAQALPTVVVSSEALPTSAINTNPRISTMAEHLAVPSLQPREVHRSVNLNGLYENTVHPSYRNIRLRCLLKDPRGFQQNSNVTVGQENRFVLEMHLQAEGGRISDMGWQGIALPRTRSVKQSDQPTPAGFLHFSIEVHGRTTGVTLTQPCDTCCRREMRPLGSPPGLLQYLIDFKSDSPFVLFSRADTPPYINTEVAFHFICHSNHQKEDIELVATLHDEQGNLVAYHHIPYSFKSITESYKGRGQQDYNPSIVLAPFASPAATTVASESESSYGSYRTPSPRSTVSASSQLGGHHRTSVRFPSQHLSQRKNVQVQGIGSRVGIQQLGASNQPLLQRVAPIEGPTRGGLSIVLIGTDLPPCTNAVYARFGSAVAETSWINQSTLECILPTSPVPGLVDVTLSLSPDHDAPTLGQSSCTFTYRDEQESFLITLRSVSCPGDELPRVSPDILVPQVLRKTSPEAINHALRLLAQNQDGPPPIDNQELEELGVRFLESRSHVRDWSNNLSVADQNRQTIAHRCVLLNYTQLLTRVVGWDIDLDVQDVSGLTALHCAYLCENWACVRILKNAGAGENIKDNLGRIPREMCQHVESEGIIYSEREVASTPARFSSVGDQVWADVASPCASPETVTLLGAHTMLQPPWRSSGNINAVGGTHASPMPIPAPWSERYSNVDDESWTQAFNNLQISESPPPLAVPSTITNSASGAPQYDLNYSPPPHGIQWNAPTGAPPTSHDLPITSSFDTLVPVFTMPQPGAPPFPVPDPAVPFPIPEPAVPFPIPELAASGPLPIPEPAEPALSSFSYPVLDPAIPPFPVPEPTGSPEEINHCTNLQSRQLPLQWDPVSSRMVPSLTSRYHIPAQTSFIHGPHITLPNLPIFPSQQLSPQSIQRPNQPPNASSTRYAPPPGPPPRNVPLGGAVPRPPCSPSQRAKEWEAIRRQLQEVITVWPSAGQEEQKQSVRLRMEEKPVTLEKGALADLKASTKEIKVGVDHSQQPKQGGA